MADSTMTIEEFAERYFPNAKALVAYFDWDNDYGVDEYVTVMTFDSEGIRLGIDWSNTEDWDYDNDVLKIPQEERLYIL